MKKTYFIALATIFALNANAQTKVGVKKTTAVAKKNTSTTKTIAKPVTTAAIKTKLDSASYAFGISMGKNLKGEGIENLNYDLLVKGLKDGFAAANPLLNDEACRQAINSIFERYAKIREENNNKKFEPMRKEGEAFLATNKTKPGITTTASGLQYEVITLGTGPKPAATDQVTVHYKGTLLNGKEFDSSYKRNEPATFGLNQVISGWTEGVQLMPEGSKFRFFIPYQLAYGHRGAGADIPPFSALIFEVELLKIAK